MAEFPLEEEASKEIIKEKYPNITLEIETDAVDTYKSSINKDLIKSDYENIYNEIKEDGKVEYKSTINKDLIQTDFSSVYSEIKEEGKTEGINEYKNSDLETLKVDFADELAEYKTEILNTLSIDTISKEIKNQIIQQYLEQNPSEEITLDYLKENKSELLEEYKTEVLNTLTYEEIPTTIKQQIDIIVVTQYKDNMTLENLQIDFAKLMPELSKLKITEYWNLFAEEYKKDKELSYQMLPEGILNIFNDANISNYWNKWLSYVNLSLHSKEAYDMIPTSVWSRLKAILDDNFTLRVTDIKKVVTENGITVEVPLVPTLPNTLSNTEIANTIIEWLKKKAILNLDFSNVIMTQEVYNTIMASIKSVSVNLKMINVYVDGISISSNSKFPLLNNSNNCNII